MAVALVSRNDDSEGGLNLSTVSDKQRNKVMRVKGDIDKLFNERNLQMDANAQDLPYIDLYGFPIDTQKLILISKEKTEEVRMGIFALKDREVSFATPQPGFTGQDLVIADFQSKGYFTKTFLCSEASFQKLVKSYDLAITYKAETDEFSINPERIEALVNSGVDPLADLETEIAHISISELMERLLIGAVQRNASDIHIEPEKELCNVRFRLDGVLHIVATFNPEIQKRIESRIKLICGMKLNVDNVPQDGRFSFSYLGKEIDLRVSMLPSNYGYSVVMRLLGTGSVALDLESLGFMGEARKRVEREII